MMPSMTQSSFASGKTIDGLLPPSSSETGTMRVVTGCRRCADVCPVGADYAAMLSDALEAIPENTPEKEARAAAMNAEEKAGHLPETYAEHRRWIGDLPPHGS